jgi:hypothetical protein
MAEMQLQMTVFVHAINPTNAQQNKLRCVAVTLDVVALKNKLLSVLLSSLKAVGGRGNPFPYVQLLGSGIKLSAFFSCSRTIPALKSLMNSSCIQVFSQNNNRSANSLKCVHDQFACNQPI